MDAANYEMKKCVTLGVRKTISRFAALALMVFGLMLLGMMPVLLCPGQAKAGSISLSANELTGNTLTFGIVQVWTTVKIEGSCSPWEYTVTSSNTDVVRPGEVESGCIFDLTKTGTGTAKLTVTDKYGGSKTITVVCPAPKWTLSKYSVTLSEPKPSATVYLKDFHSDDEWWGPSVVISNPNVVECTSSSSESITVTRLAPGTATITLTDGTGYSKTLKVICKQDASYYDIGNATITLPDGYCYPYSPSDGYTPDVVVRLHGKKLVEGVDYRVGYSYDSHSLGEGDIDVEGIGEYKGACYASFYTVPVVGSLLKTHGATYRVTKVYENNECEVRLAKAPNKKTITVGSRVSIDGYLCWIAGIDAKAFAQAKKCKTLKVENTSLSKKRVKKCLKGSKVKKVDLRKVCAVGYEYGLKVTKKYKKYFSKKNCGKRVKFVDAFKKAVVKRKGWYIAGTSNGFGTAIKPNVREMFVKGNRLYVYGKMKYSKSGKSLGKTKKLTLRVFKLSSKTKYRGWGGDGPAEKLSKNRFKSLVNNPVGLGLKIRVKHGKVVEAGFCS